LSQPIIYAFCSSIGQLFSNDKKYQQNCIACEYMHMKSSEKMFILGEFFIGVEPWWFSVMGQDSLYGAQRVTCFLYIDSIEMTGFEQ